MFCLTFCSVEYGRVQPSTKPFTITIKADKIEFSVNSDIWITVSITNTSDNDLDMSGGISSRTGLDPNYKFDVWDAKGRPTTKKVFRNEGDTGSPFNRVVKPGETYTEKQRISALYDLRSPGSYVIQVSRRRSDDKKDGLIESNKITIDITGPVSASPPAPRQEK